MQLGKYILQEFDKFKLTLAEVNRATHEKQAKSSSLQLIILSENTQIGRLNLIRKWSADGPNLI